MNRKSRLATILTGLTIGAVILAMAAPALAARGGNPGKPPKPPTTTTTEVPAGSLSCAERIANGAIWTPGSWNGTNDYEVDGFTSCIDLTEPGHAISREWTVTWTSGEAQKVKDFKLVFEYGIHGTEWATGFFSSGEGSWTTTIFSNGLEPLVFVAKTPHRW
jgi:hypothetical protein